MSRIRWLLIHWLLIWAALIPTGCQRRSEASRAVFRTETEFVLMMVFDLSGSFDGLMDEGAFDTALFVLDGYFADRVGSEDKLIVAAISGDDQSLVWEGKPHDLRKKFTSGEDFRVFLEERCPDRSSEVYRGLDKAVRYLMAEPAVHAGKAKSAVIVLSDMVDTGEAPGKSANDLIDTLTEFAAAGGVLGMYYVDVDRALRWKPALRDMGFKDFIVESEIAGRPALPNLE